ncbi:MAG: pirin [Parcubacteria group bacterium]|nr:pirin [Parcubacteria group bacterium]
MEIITIVTAGTLTHEDNIGNKGVIPAGDVQMMSAGTGVVHGERNDGDEPLTLFQLWIEAKEKGIEPRYGQSEMHLTEQPLGLRLVTAPLGTPDVLTINQDAYLYHAGIDPAHPIEYALHHPAHGVYLFVIEGRLDVAGKTLGPRDALGITETSSIAISATEPSRALLFEVPLG